MLTSRIALIALALTAGCSIPNATFTPLGGDDDAGVDAEVTELKLVVSTSSLEIPEGNQGTFTIALSQPPSGLVLVAVESTQANASATPTTVLFDTNNWNTAQTVTVSGLEDPNTVDLSAMINLTSAAAGDATVDVKVVDNDVLKVVVGVSSLDVGENATSQLNVRLSAEPTGPTTVNIASGDLAVATVSPATLMFTVANWNVDQNVVVTGVDDANVVDATTSLSLTSTGLPNVSVPVKVIDEDVLGIGPATTNLGTLTEGGTTTLGVKLTQAPSANVTVNVASSDTGAVAVSPASLTFTPTNWNVEKTVTVTLPQDDDVADEAAQITLSSTGLTSRTVAAAVNDDDVQSIVATPAPLALNEGNSGSLAVHLAFRPAANTTVQVATLNSSVATVNQTSLVFTPSNYATNQSVTVTATQDPNLVAGSTKIRLQSVADALTTDASINVSDDDTQIIVAAESALEINEGDTAPINVTLGFEPASNVTVNVTSDDTSIAAIAGTLTFTPQNYNVAQKVMITAPADDADYVNGSTVVRFALSGATGDSTTIQTEDDDLLNVPPGPGPGSVATILMCKGQLKQIPIYLNGRPLHDVVVTFAGTGLGSQYSITPSSLMWTTIGNPSTVQNITINPLVGFDYTFLEIKAPGQTSGYIRIGAIDPCF